VTRILRIDGSADSAGSTIRQFVDRFAAQAPETIVKHRHLAPTPTSLLAKSRFGANSCLRRRGAGAAEIAAMAPASQ
jgi:hypothetical protein